MPTRSTCLAILSVSIQERPMPTSSTFLAILSISKYLRAILAHMFGLLHAFKLLFLLMILLLYPLLLPFDEILLSFDKPCWAIALLSSSIVTSHCSHLVSLWLKCAFLHLFLFSLEFRLPRDFSVLLILLLSVVHQAIGCGCLRGFPSP
jgi:hypothetical protein